MRCCKMQAADAMMYQHTLLATKQVGENRRLVRLTELKLERTDDLWKFGKAKKHKTQTDDDECRVFERKNTL